MPDMVSSAFPVTAESDTHAGVVQTSSAQRYLLGDLLLQEGLITELQLREALRIQRDETPYFLLGQILVDRGYLTQRQLQYVLDKYQKKYRLGDLLVETRAITEDQLKVALLEQRATGLRLGEILVDLGYLSEDQMRRTLALQMGVAFVDLDGVEIDGDLASVIDRTYAEIHQVIPLAKLDDRLILAMDDPCDADVIDELSAEFRCRVQVVTALREGFSRAFSRLYGVAPERASRRAQPGDPVSPDPSPASGDAASSPGAPAGCADDLDARIRDGLQTLALMRTTLDRLYQAYAQDRQLLRDREARYNALLTEQGQVADRLSTILHRLRDPGVLPPVIADPT